MRRSLRRTLLLAALVASVSDGFAVWGLPLRGSDGGDFVAGGESGGPPRSGGLENGVPGRGLGLGSGDVGREIVTRQTVRGLNATDLMGRLTGGQIPKSPDPGRRGLRNGPIAGRQPSDDSLSPASLASSLVDGLPKLGDLASSKTKRNVPPTLPKHAG
ncbi:MAG: hypothetical protein M1813_001428 [Trichoglossum hirsutum]|nr:MAG: hypothetical protein M1813_001428 [Trichoglossum hirsutum]